MQNILENSGSRSHGCLVFWLFHRRFFHLSHQALIEVLDGSARGGTKLLL